MWHQWPRSGMAQPSMEKVAEEAPQSPTPSMGNLVSAIVKELPAIQREASAHVVPLHMTKGTIWRHPQAHPLVLTLLLLDRYGQDYLTWDADSLQMSLTKESVLLSNSAWTKIQAARVILNSPNPWRRWEVFNAVVRGLNGHQPNFQVYEPPQLGHVAAAVDMMRTVDPTRDPLDEVRKYTSVIFRDNGIPYAPAPLDYAQRELDQPKIKCRKCGTIDRDDHDIRCVACGSTDLEHIPGPYEGLRDQVKRRVDPLLGKDTKTAVRSMVENEVDVPAAKLLTHWGYRDKVRGQLLSQLHMIRST